MTPSPTRSIAAPGSHEPHRGAPMVVPGVLEKACEESGLTKPEFIQVCMCSVLAGYAQEIPCDSEKPDTAHDGDNQSGEPADAVGGK